VEESVCYSFHNTFNLSFVTANIFSSAVVAMCFDHQRQFQQLIWLKTRISGNPKKVNIQAIHGET